LEKEKTKISSAKSASTIKLKDDYYSSSYTILNC